MEQAPRRSGFPAQVGNHPGVQQVEIRRVRLGGQRRQGGERLGGPARALLGPGAQHRAQQAGLAVARQAADAPLGRRPVSGARVGPDQHQGGQIVAGQPVGEPDRVRAAAHQGGVEGAAQQFGVGRAAGQRAGVERRRLRRIALGEGEPASEEIGRDAGGRARRRDAGAGGERACERGGQQGDACQRGAAQTRELERTHGCAV